MQGDCEHLQYLDAEITRLRNKRMKLPLKMWNWGDAKVQNKNEMLIKEYLADLPK
jgi:hypothetical protein